MKGPKLAVVVLAVIVVLAGAVWIWGKKSGGWMPATLTRVQTGEAVKVANPQTEVAVGTKEVTVGSFDRIDTGYIYVGAPEGIVKIALTDDVVLSCTKQTLAGITNYDFAMVTAVQVFKQAQIETKLVKGETVVVLSSQVDGAWKGNTVGINGDRCK